MARNITHGDLDAFLRRLPREDYLARLNYFRWMEYPLTLSLLDARPGMKVLDVGSGLISLPPLYLAGELGCRVTAVDKRECNDKSRHFIGQISRQLGIAEGALELRTMDAGNLEFEDNTFDRVSAVSMLEHLPLFYDSKVMLELGRVLAPGGRLVFSVPFNLGHHIEMEQWNGEEYEQRHYNEYTLRQRLIDPSQLHFRRAIAFGEINQEVGKSFIEMPVDQRRDFCFSHMAHPENFWREFYHVQDLTEFSMLGSALPPAILQRAGVIAVVLEKEEGPPPSRFISFDPVTSYRQNRKLCKTAENSDRSIVIDEVKIFNFWGDWQQAFQSGETMNISIAFRCRGEVEEPCFRIIFQNGEDETVCALNTTQAGYRFGRLKGKNRIDVRFGMLNLLPGEYKLTVGAWEYDEPNPLPPYPYDVHYQAYTVVIGMRLPGLSGVAYSPYEIKMEKLGD